MPSIVRSPSAQVTIGGNQIACEEVSVSQDKKGGSGKFSAKVPLSVMAAAGMGLDWIADPGDDDSIQVQFSNDGDDFVDMFTGTLDKIDIDASTKDQMVNISGRDASKKLKNQKTNEKFQNKKHEEIAQDIAGRGGLTLNTDGNTGMAGRIYTEEQAKVTGNQSLWAMIHEVAESEGKIPLVIGSTLHFTTLDDPSLPTYPVTYTPPTPDTPAYSSGLVSIKLGRDYEASKKHTVNVNSWDHKKKQLTTSTQTSGSGEPEQTYNYQHHHKTQDQADRHAKSKIKEHTRHAFDLTIEMPGDTGLTPLFQIDLSGTNSAFDQTYHIDNIDHKMSTKDGYRMTISTKCGKDDKGGKGASK